MIFPGQPAIICITGPDGFIHATWATRPASARTWCRPYKRTEAWAFFSWPPRGPTRSRWCPSCFELLRRNGLRGKWPSEEQEGPPEREHAA